jgi:hypothetical protein
MVAISRGDVVLCDLLYGDYTLCGDYTAERHRWLGKYTAQDLAQEIKDQRQATSGFVQHRQSVFDAWNAPDSRAATA